MRCDWKECTINDVCSRIYSGGTPNKRHSEYYSGGKIPWLNTAENKADYNYVYYWLCLMYEQLASRAIGSAQQNLNAGQIKEFPIIIPPLETQKKISAILSPLDDKIELNKRINDNLEQQARAIFKHWFIDSDYRLGTASEIIEYHDSKRIPISSRERSKLAKIYPYYGAASVRDYVDRYIFDGVYLLLGEGCSV